MQRLGRCSLGQYCKHGGWVYEGEVMRQAHGDVIHEDCCQAGLRLAAAFAKTFREVIVPAMERQRGGMLALTRAVQQAAR